MGKQEEEVTPRLEGNNDHILGTDERAFGIALEYLMDSELRDCLVNNFVVCEIVTKRVA